MEQQFFDQQHQAEVKTDVPYLRVKPKEEIDLSKLQHSRVKRLEFYLRGALIDPQSLLTSDDISKLFHPVLSGLKVVNPSGESIYEYEWDSAAINNIIAALTARMLKADIKPDPEDLRLFAEFIRPRIARLVQSIKFHPLSTEEFLESKESWSESKRNKYRSAFRR